MNTFVDLKQSLDSHLGFSQRTLIRLALEKTQKMLEEAECGRWEDIQTLENERKVILKRCFEQKIDQRNSVIFAEALATMLHLNEELVALLEAAKANAAARHKGDREAHEAIGHYLDAKTDYL